MNGYWDTNAYSVYFFVSFSIAELEIWKLTFFQITFRLN
jgi:hypothetical protein